MNSIIPFNQLPSHRINKRYSSHTARKATPKQRVKGLLGFPFSELIREHTIQELLKDSETADLAKGFLNK